MSADTQQQALFKAILRLFKPLVRLLLRNGIPFGVFAEIARQAYVEVAFKEFGVPGRKASDSRVATITGLTRKEVSRLKNLDEQSDKVSVAKYHRAARVVYGWVHDSRYAAGPDESINLQFDGGPISFSELVKEYSGDVPPRAVLDELLQVGVVEKLPDESLRLIVRAYIPHTSEGEKLQILGRDVAGLIATIDHNIYDKKPVAFFQRKVFYDNLPEEYIPELRELVRKHGQSLLEKMDEKMAPNDRDVNPTRGGTGRKAAGIGIYYFEDDEAVEK